MKAHALIRRSQSKKLFRHSLSSRTKANSITSVCLNARQRLWDARMRCVFQNMVLRLHDLRFVEGSPDSSCRDRSESLVIREWNEERYVWNTRPWHIDSTLIQPCYSHRNGEGAQYCRGRLFVSLNVDSLWRLSLTNNHAGPLDKESLLGLSANPRTSPVVIICNIIPFG